MSASSSAPPPPVSASPPPPPLDRGARRNQRRESALARRQQRQWLNAQNSVLRRSSVLGPVLLISAGMAFLFVEIVQLPMASVLTWLGHGWPAVLVVAGIVLMAEWAIDSRTDQMQGTVLPRRRLGAGAGFLLLLIVLAGLSASGIIRAGGFLQSWNPAGAGGFWNMEHFLGKRVDSEQTLAAALPKDGRFFIENRHGNIFLSGTSTDDQVHIVAHQHLWAWHDAELRDKQKREMPSLETQSSGLYLLANGDGQDETDLTITVPPKALVDVANQNGEIDATALQGELAVDTHHGQINLSALTGPVKLVVHDKNTSLVAHDLTGDVTVQGKGGDLSLSDVRGSVHLEGDFYGTTHLTNVSNGVAFQSTHSEFRCASLPGELTIQGRELIEARNLRGPVLVSTADRDVVLEKVQGSVRITNRKGDVTLNLSGAPQPVEISTTRGDVHLTLQGKPAFNLKAYTGDGDIEDDFGVAARKDGDDARLVIDTKTEAPALSLQTSKGDIEVRSAPTSEGGALPQEP